MTDAIYLPNTIKTMDGVQEYPTDIVRELFVCSDMNIEDLAIQLNLPVKVVEQHAKAGVQSWYRLKEQKLAERLQYFSKINTDNLVETHSTLEDAHFLTLIQYKGMLTFVKQYYAKHGHLFRVNEDNEITLDSFGVPIPIPLPNGPKQLMTLEGILRLKEGTKNAMKSLYDANKKKADSDTIDIDSMGIFDESDE